MVVVPGLVLEDLRERHRTVACASGLWGGDPSCGARCIAAMDVDVDHRGGVTFGVWVIGIHIAEFAGVPAKIANHATAVTGLIRFLRIEVFAETADPGTGEDAEDVPLVVVKLRWGFAAEGKKIVSEEGLHASQGQVGELWAVVEENLDALHT